MPRALTRIKGKCATVDAEWQPDITNNLCGGQIHFLNNGLAAENTFLLNCAPIIFRSSSIASTVSQPLSLICSFTLGGVGGRTHTEEEAMATSSPSCPSADGVNPLVLTPAFTPAQVGLSGN